MNLEKAEMFLVVLQINILGLLCLFEPTLLNYQGWLFPGFSPMCVLKFFPSSDVMNASKLKIFQLKELHFEHPCHLTWWEKPVFHGACALGQNPGIANLYFSNVGLAQLVLSELKAGMLTTWPPPRPRCIVLFRQESCGKVFASKLIENISTV